MLPDPSVSLPPSLMAVLSWFAGCFTAPTFRTFCALTAGLAAQTGRRTVCGMILGAGLGGVVRHERFHRFFSAAAWCPDELGLTLAGLLAGRLIPPGAELVVVVDDTLLKRWGRKVFGVFWTHDGAAQGKEKLGRGNRWVGSPRSWCTCHSPPSRSACRYWPGCGAGRAPRRRPSWPKTWCSSWPRRSPAGASRSSATPPTIPRCCATFRRR